MAADYKRRARHRLTVRARSEEYKQQFKEKWGDVYVFSDRNGNNIEHMHAMQTAKKSEHIWRLRHEGCPDALYIAGMWHDCDRFFPKLGVRTWDFGVEKYRDAKREHSYNSAYIFEIRNNDFPASLIGDASYLIIRHEVGGEREEGKLISRPLVSAPGGFNLNEAADILMSADSFSFLTYILAESYIPKKGKERLMDKINYSLRRLSPELLEEIGRFRFEDLKAAKYVERGLSDLKEEDIIIKT